MSFAGRGGGGGVQTPPRLNPHLFPIETSSTFSLFHFGVMCVYGDLIYIAPIAHMLKVIVDKTLKPQCIAVINYGLMQVSRME